MFVLTPFMPVNQVQSSLNWPQDPQLSSVNAPLISYAPQEFSAEIPLNFELNPEQTTVLSTLPESAEDATSRGLFVRKTDEGLDVIVRNKVALELSQEEFADLPEGAVLRISSTKDATTVDISGTSYSGEIEDDERPQVTGIYSELASASPDLNARVEINSRFTSSPSLWKSLTMWLGLAALLVSLFGLRRMDTGKHEPFPRPKLKFYDVVVLGILGIWYIFGANTSDDGYLLTMGRVAEHAGYMANYYRWFGVPESPFGAPYYDLLGYMSQVSTSSIWMRLPQLIAALGTWWLVSREVLPRIGARRDVAYWTAAFSFLGFWMVYNNGLRPEPVIALGALLTWVAMERAIASRNLFPAAVAVIIATISLAAGPTGLMAVAALLIGLPQVLEMLKGRWWALGAFAASGTAILIAVFGDQTLANVIEAIKVRSEKGPSLRWYNEWVRYQTLLQQDVDGSFTRRFAVLMMFVCLAIVVATMLRHGRVPGTNIGPSRRLTLVFFGTMFFLMFTPTKWTHHFGVYAGLGAALAGLAALAVADLLRQKWLFIGGLMFVLAFSLSGPNGWWYISSFGIPWWDKTIQYRHVEAATVMLVLSLIVITYGVYRLYRPAKPTRFQPLPTLLALVAVFSVLSLLKGFVAMYPAYSVGLGNLRSLSGNYCALANDAMVETDSNDVFLTPIEGTLGESLESGEESRGFAPNNIPDTIAVEKATTTNLSGSIAAAASGDAAVIGTDQESGTREMVGINGSTIALPFNLDYTKVPVLGSHTFGTQFPAELTSQWYELPARDEQHPLIVITAAGRIYHHDINGVEQKGQDVVLEYGRRNGDQVEVLGEYEPMDIGPSPSWRNLRIPVADLPAEANVVRIHAEDSSLDPEQWLALTPPRLPSLAPLNEVVGSEAPTLLDWAVSLQFPCQRPFDHWAGVEELPEYRVAPDHVGIDTLTPWMDYDGGGPMGIVEAVNLSTEIPGYLNHDWGRDWGTLYHYTPRPNSKGEEPKIATIDYEVIPRSGLWYPGPMKLS